MEPLKPFASALSERIILARRMRKLTQAQLAEKASVMQSQVSKLESKKVADPSLHFILSLCEALVVPFSTLVQGSMDELITHLDKAVESPEDFAAESLLHPDGVLHGRNAASQENVIINRFSSDINNPNIFVSGLKGKTYWAKAYALQEAMLGNRVYIMDGNNEYTKIAEDTKGEVVNLSQEKINILDFSIGMPEGNISALDAQSLGNPLMQRLRPVREFLSFIYRLQYHETMDTSLGALSEHLLLKLYAQYGYDVKSPNTQLIAKSTNMPVLSDLQREFISVYRQDKSPDKATPVHLRHLILALEPYVGIGEHAHEFDNKTTIKSSASSGITTFSKRHPLMQYLILDYMQQKLFSLDQRKMPKPVTILIDGIDTLIESEEGLRLVEDVTRASRKFRVGMTLLVKDFDKAATNSDGSPRPGFRAIIQNCYTRVLFNSSPTERDIIKETFRLSDDEMRKLSATKHGQYLLLLGPSKVWVNSSSSEE